MLRIYVLSGQFGRGPISMGMGALAERLRPYGDVTYRLWRDLTVVDEINNLSTDNKVAVIGYSLGANQLGWLDTHVKRRRINLGVAYDPSKQSPLVQRTPQGEYVQVVSIYDKLICYYHPKAWIFGGSKYEGPNTRNIVVTDLHLGMQFNNNLHEMTIEEVRRLSKAT